MPGEKMNQSFEAAATCSPTLGLPDAAELDTKARLCAAINRIVERRRLSQADIASTLGVNQPKVSALLHYKLEGFSVERLMNFLLALGMMWRYSSKQAPIAGGPYRCEGRVILRVILRRA